VVRSLFTVPDFRPVFSFGFIETYPPALGVPLPYGCNLPIALSDAFTGQLKTPVIYRVRHLAPALLPGDWFKSMAWFVSLLNSWIALWHKSCALSAGEKTV